MSLLFFLFIATAMTLLCLFLQAIVGVSMVQFMRKRNALSCAHTPLGNFRTLSTVMLILMAGNLLQIIVWAWLYQGLGEFEHFGEAFYFSGVTFTSLGYGDITLNETYRSLAPIQTAVGLMMFGISVAALFAAMQRQFSK